MALTIKILYSLEKLVTVPDTYYNYRKTPGSLVTQQSEKHKRDYKWANAELYNFAEANNITFNIKRAFHKKEVFKIFGFTILKIYYYETVIKYKLLGFIPFLTKTGF